MCQVSWAARLIFRYRVYAQGWPRICASLRWSFSKLRGYTGGALRRIDPQHRRASACLAWL